MWCTLLSPKCHGYPPHSIQLRANTALPWTATGPLTCHTHNSCSSLKRSFKSCWKRLKNSSKRVFVTRFPGDKWKTYVSMAASLLNFASINIYLGLGGGKIRKKTTIQSLQSLNTVTQRSLFRTRNREHVFSMCISIMLFILSICILLLPFLHQKIISMSLAHYMHSFSLGFLVVIDFLLCWSALFLSQQAIHFKTLVQKIKKLSSKIKLVLSSFIFIWVKYRWHTSP